MATAGQIEIENSTRIAAPAATVLTLAAQVEDWPRVLGHYRRVTVLAERPEGRVMEMVALRPPLPLPVRWRAIQRVDSAGLRVLYRHVGGVTRGMEVEWLIVPHGDGVEVRIVHRFSPPWPWPGPWLARRLVCGFFVHAIADRTLAGIKAEAERRQTKPASYGAPVRSESNSA